MVDDVEALDAVLFTAVRVGWNGGYLLEIDAPFTHRFRPVFRLMFRWGWVEDAAVLTQNLPHGAG